MNCSHRTPAQGRESTTGPAYNSCMSLPSQRFRLISSCVTVLLSATVLSWAQETQPVSNAPASAPTTTQPTPQANDVTPETLQWLDKLEAQSKQTRTLTADIRYDREQGLLGDRQRRFGKLVYESGPPARYAIHFRRVLVDKRADEQNRWYIFDGRWMVEKLEDQKQFFAHELVAPGSPAERSNPLAMGEGPFAVPIGAEKDRLLRRYSVSVQLPEVATKDEPANSVRLTLKPRPGQRNNFTTIDFWYDRSTLAPLQARTEDESENVSLIVLSNVKTNENIDASLMDTRAPSALGQSGWREEIRPWEK